MFNKTSKSSWAKTACKFVIKSLVRNQFLQRYCIIIKKKTLPLHNLVNFDAHRLRSLEYFKVSLIDWQASKNSLSQMKNVSYHWKLMKVAPSIVKTWH